HRNGLPGSIHWKISKNTKVLSDESAESDAEVTWRNVEEERVARDRKAFLLHSQFVDISIFMTIKAIQHVMESNIKNESNSPISILHKERVGDLYASSELATDVTINVGEVKFYLHKFPLLSKSKRLQKLMSKASEEDSDDIYLDDFPGGPKAFEISAKFCYEMTVTLNAYNVVAACCAAEYLEMTEDIDLGNLVFKIEVFLNSGIFCCWKDSIIVLQTCNSFLPWSKDLNIIERCIGFICHVKIRSVMLTDIEEDEFLDPAVKETLNVLQSCEIAEKKLYSNKVAKLKAEYEK
ncbi:hypothetical protein S83_070435, partial [Arachis hypogaea]